MFQLCVYGAAALFCFALYIALAREIYFLGRKAYRTKGVVHIVLPCGSSWQFVVEYRSPNGLKHSTLSPTYDSSLPCVEDSSSRVTAPLDVGERVNITVRPFRFGPIQVNALRIEDKNLVKQANYKALIILGCAFIFMGLIRAAAIFLV